MHPTAHPPAAWNVALTEFPLEHPGVLVDQRVFGRQKCVFQQDEDLPAVLDFVGIGQISQMDNFFVSKAGMVRSIKVTPVLFSDHCFLPVDCHRKTLD